MVQLLSVPMFMVGLWLLFRARSAVETDNDVDGDARRVTEGGSRAAAARRGVERGTAVRPPSGAVSRLCTPRAVCPYDRHCR